MVRFWPLFVLAQIHPLITCSITMQPPNVRMLKPPRKIRVRSSFSNNQFYRSQGSAFERRRRGICKSQVSFQHSPTSSLMCISAGSVVSLSQCSSFLLSELEKDQMFDPIGSGLWTGTSRSVARIVQCTDLYAACGSDIDHTCLIFPFCLAMHTFPLFCFGSNAK